MAGQSEVNFKILIIDDNFDIHSDFEKVLVLKKGNDELDRIEALLFDEKPKLSKLPSFDVDFASQGEEGYQKVVKSINDKQPYAMAFVDIRMPPGWNGIETVQKIWEIDPKLEIVFCSAYSDFSLADIYEKIINKKNEFLVIKKPFDVVEIRQAATSMCQVWNLKRKLEKRIEEVEGQLLHSDKMASLGQLAAGVAHEINNPVGYINSNIQMLQKYVDDLLDLVSIYQKSELALPKPSEALSQIESVKSKIDLDFLKKDVVNLIEESREGVERVKKIIQDLKDFSHRGMQVWDGYDLNKGIGSTLNIIQHELRQNEIVLNTDLGTLPKIEAVGPQINQVILNLLINSIQAVGEKGVIDISTKSDQDFVYFKIFDSGKGIKEEDLNKIFEPFFTTKPVGQGTGLGLYLSYGIVQKHHGSIAVTSEINKGTTFTVNLPIKQAMEVNHHLAS